MEKLSKIFLLIFCLSLFGCHRDLTIIEGEQMTIPYRIMLGDSLSSQDLEILKTRIAKVFRTIDTVYNNWNPDSEISYINRASANTPIPLSEDLWDFLQKIEVLYSLSEGRFDPTLGQLKSLWLTHLKRHSLPDEGTWQKYYQQSGWKNISLNAQNRTLTKKYATIQLDLCGAVKGLAVDYLLEECQKFSVNNYVEWGGEIKTSGHHPSGRSWRIASASTSKILEITDSAIATSGSYYQHWSVNEKTYTHILDPKTGKPLESHNHPIISATVVHPNCAFADGIATVLMTFSNKTEAETWAKKHHLTVFIHDNAS